MKRIGPAKAIPLSLLATIVLIEIVLRCIMGHLGMPELVTTDPPDGRRVGLIPDASTVYSGHFVRIPPVVQEVNSLGYRGPVRPRKKAQGTFRIIALGDSHIYGMGVVTDQTIPAHLEKEIASRGRSLEVLNFGVGGFTLEDCIDQFRHFAYQWEPDLVLLFIESRDLDPSLVDHIAVLSPAFRYSYIFRVVFPLVYEFVMKDQYAAFRTEAALRSRLDEMIGLSREHSARLAMVIQSDPVLWRDIPDETTTSGKDSTGDLHRLAGLFSENGIPWYDASDWDSPGSPRSLPKIPNEGHFTGEGNRMAAAEVADWLLRDGLL